MQRKPLYVAPGANPGLLIKGNIDINNRPAVKNPNGGISSVFSAIFGITIDGRQVYVVLPRVVGTRIVSNTQAFQHFMKTKRHLGIFDTLSHAKSYAHRLHLQQASLAKTTPR